MKKHSAHHSNVKVTNEGALNYSGTALANVLQVLHIEHSVYTAAAVSQTNPTESYWKSLCRYVQVKVSSHNMYAAVPVTGRAVPLSSCMPLTSRKRTDWPPCSPCGRLSMHVTTPGLAWGCQKVKCTGLSVSYNGRLIAEGEPNKQAVHQ